MSKKKLRKRTRTSISATSTITPRRALVRYHGGKWRLAEWIIPYFPPHGTYVECFGGGGSVLLRKPRSPQEIYNDLDHGIVNLFTVVRDRGAELKRALELTPWSREEFYLAYEPTPDPLELARRTIVRSWMGHGMAAMMRPVKDGTRSAKSGFRAANRTDGGRGGNSALTSWLNLPEVIPQTIARLRGVVIENKDALEVMRQQDTTHTLHYVDPPYVPETRGEPKVYMHEMTVEQHVEMGDLLNDLKGMVVLSGYACDLYDKKLFKHWKRVTCAAYADGGRAREEVLWLNDAAARFHRENLWW
jgi:DNA adenine methylase